MKWKVCFEDEDGMWLHHSDTTDALRKAGYAVGGFRKWCGSGRTYTLHHLDANGGASFSIYETDDLDLLNAYINLILPPREET